VEEQTRSGAAPRRRLQKSEMADGKFLGQIENEIALHVKEAVDFALNEPYPDPNEVNQHVYA
jgi:TPP-dependent pyruvate/acetoin dehydrogenase alpha subunit